MFDNLDIAVFTYQMVFYRRYRGRHGTAYLNIDEDLVMSIGWKLKDGRKRTWIDTEGGPYAVMYIVSSVFAGATDKKTRPLRRWLYRQLSEFAFDFCRTISRSTHLFNFKGGITDTVVLTDKQKDIGGKITPSYYIARAVKYKTVDEFKGLNPRNPFKDISLLRHSHPIMYSKIVQSRLLYAFARIRMSYSRNAHKVRKWYRKKMAGSDHL